MVLVPHRAGIESVPSLNITGDQALGQRRGLTHKEPVPPGGREPGVTTGQGLADWHITEDDDPIHAVGMVKRQALHDIAAAVVAHSVEAMMAEHIHDGEQISGHRALTRLGVIREVRRGS